MEPLSWSDHPDLGKDELTAELRALHRHLEEWAVGQAGAELIAPLLSFLEHGSLVEVERLRQTFFPAVDVLRLRLEIQGQQSVGVFLRQRMARGYPALWPIADSSGNLYEFVEAIPGVLDMTPGNVVDYGLFFANEAIAGDEGRFHFHRDFASWPESVQQQARVTAAAGQTSDPIVPGDDDPGSRDFLRRLAAYLARPAGDRTAEFEQLHYDREHDQYRFSVFGEYAGQAYAAEIRVNRATGLPEMERDLVLAPIETAAPHVRLPAVNLSPALKRLAAPDPGTLPNDALPALDPAAAATAIRQTHALESVRVTGDLVIDKSLPLAALRIERCVIEGSIRAEGIAVAGDLTVARVRVGGDFELAGAKIGGRLSLGQLTTGGQIDFSDTLVTLRAHCVDLRTRAVLARHLVVERGALLIGPEGGDPAATGIIAAESVDLSGASATSGITITDSHLGGQLNLRDCRTSGTIELGAAAETRMFVRGRVDLSGIEAGADVLVRGVHVGADVVLAGGRVAGHLRFGSPPRPASRAGQDCTIARDLVATNCEIKGPLVLGGVQIQGTLRLELASLGSLVSEGRIVEQRSADRFATIQPTVIRNGVEILACTIRGELRLGRALLDQRYAGLFSFEMTSTTVGQGVSFWDEGAMEPRTTESFATDLDLLARGGTTRDPPDGFESSRPVRLIIGPFERTPDRVGWPVVVAGEPLPRLPLAGPMIDETEGDAGTEISVGELESHLSARHFFTAIHGDVRLALCRIGGDLSLDNLRADGHRIVLESVTIDGDLLAEWKGRRYRAPAEASALPYQGILMTTAAVLDASGITVVGEARCAGLVLSGPRSGRGPALAIRYSKVEGVLALADPTAHEAPAGRATIVGDLDVSWSAIDQLILDGRSLGVGEWARTAPPHRLIATNVTIRKLELWDPLPGEVDLADAKVVVWDFGPVEGSVLLARFRNVLDNQQPFKRNVYQEVEAYLYNAGFEDLAKKVHTDLVTRHHRDTIGLLARRPPSASRRLALTIAWLKRTGSALNYLMTGNFTSEWRPIFVCWLPVWLISSCYFADPARLDVAPGYRSGFTEAPAQICATLDRWSAAESLKFTTRYVLPVIPSVGMEQLEAADGFQTHPLCLATSDRIEHERPTIASRIRHAFDWLRPSTAATWARLLSWLFLSLATGTIFAKMSRTPRARG